MMPLSELLPFAPVIVPVIALVTVAMAVVFVWLSCRSPRRSEVRYDRVTAYMIGRGK